jgi:hypothetical protein
MPFEPTPEQQRIFEHDCDQRSHPGWSETTIGAPKVTIDARRNRIRMLLALCSKPATALAVRIVAPEMATRHPRF